MMLESYAWETSPDALASRFHAVKPTARAERKRAKLVISPQDKKTTVAQ